MQQFTFGIYIAYVVFETVNDEYQKHDSNFRCF